MSSRGSQWALELLDMPLSQPVSMWCMVSWLTQASNQHQQRYAHLSPHSCLFLRQLHWQGAAAVKVMVYHPRLCRSTGSVKESGRKELGGWKGTVLRLTYVKTMSMYTTLHYHYRGLIEDAGCKISSEVIKLWHSALFNYDIHQKAVVWPKNFPFQHYKEGFPISMAYGNVMLSA